MFEPQNKRPAGPNPAPRTDPDCPLAALVATHICRDLDHNLLDERGRACHLGARISALGPKVSVVAAAEAVIARYEARIVANLLAWADVPEPGGEAA